MDADDGSRLVEYHEHTVAGRGDDPVAASGEYYASRGRLRSPGGAPGPGLLGLAGEVDLADYRAVFGIGGAHDPRTGRRLVGCLRPGLELVVSPHKSVAELGVIGRRRGHAQDRRCRARHHPRVPGPPRRRTGWSAGTLPDPGPTGGSIWATPRMRRPGPAIRRSRPRPDSRTLC